MVKYWLCVTNEENWKVVKERKIWGISNRYRRLLENVKPGDTLVFYVKPFWLAGIFKVISEPFKSDETIFSSIGFTKGEMFPWRVKIEPLIVAEEPIAFREQVFKKLIPKLKFIKNKKMWTGHLRRAMRTIPKEDYNLIFNAIRQ